MDNAMDVNDDAGCLIGRDGLTSIASSLPPTPKGEVENVTVRRDCQILQVGKVPVVVLQ